MKNLVLLSLILTSGLFAECKERELVVFRILEEQVDRIKKIDDHMGVDKSLEKIADVIEREGIISKMQDTIYGDIFQKMLSSQDPRVSEKLLSILKLMEISNQMKKNIDSGLMGSFESEVDNLKLLLQPQGVCPKMEKRPRKYNIEKYL